MPSTSIPSPSADALLQRIARIAPVLERSGAANEALGRLTPEVLDHLHEARLFRLLLPRAYDGEEVDLPTWFCAMEALAKCDASTAWCVGQINGCAATACALAPAVARTIWGDRRGALSWGPPVTARADAVAGGHRLTGEWGMASGSRHATWLGLMAPAFDAGGKPQRQSEGTQLSTFLVPAEAVTFIDNWQVHGLVATNSGGYRVKDLFVPNGYSVNRLQVLDSTLPAPLYKFPLNSFFAIGFSAVALGTARSLLDAALALAGDKKPRMARLALRDNHAVQLRVGEAEARLRSARGYVATTAESVWRQTVASGELEVAQRLAIRMAATFAIHEAKAVADAAWEVAGASAIFDSGPFERRMRDLTTLTQQLQGRKSHLQETGGYLLGLEPNLMFA
jgi:indole-3-acetate monooxygenase